MPGPTSDMTLLFREQINIGASDLHLKAGRPPLFRIVGEMVLSNHPPVSAEDMESALKQLLGDDGYARLNRENEMDFAFQVPNLARFRVNAFRHVGNLGLAARAIPLKAPTFDKFIFPPVLRELLSAHNGLILVTGPTGCGKSTTLACMIELARDVEAENPAAAADHAEAGAAAGPSDAAPDAVAAARAGGVASAGLAPPRSIASPPPESL